MNEDEEVIIDSTVEEARRIRVYDRNGDFVIDVPAKARITFGYFNPATPSEGAAQRGYGSPDNVARQTALRIYRTKDDQLACFLGVKGFRDLSIGLTRLTQRVTVESHSTHDDEIDHYVRNMQRELVVKSEDDYL